MVRLALPNTPYVEPATGKAVEGRMQVYLHGTNTHAPLYVRPAAEYIEAANPQLIHAGLPYATLFTPLGVFDVVIEKYIGPEGEMSVYSPDSDFEQVGDYETGIDFDIESMARNTVDTVDDLRDVDPSLGMVTVKWYSKPGDCPPRTYVWDADSQNTEDGGYVIGSDVSDSGKWILMWDDEVLPCTVYGVKPGAESNMSLLLDYPVKVGSFQMVTAPCVRFIRGTYTSNTSFSTTKELLFDYDAKFPNVKFLCPKAMMLGDMTDYVAEFAFSAQDAVAHSSWFKTVDGFWSCSAKRLVIDDTNYFTSTVMTKKNTIQNAIIEGSKRMNVTYSGGAYIKFDGCAINGSRIFNPSADYIIFANSWWKNEIWSTTAVGSFDFGNVAEGHHVQFNSNQANYFSCGEFDNPEVYLKAQDANIRDGASNNTVMDLEGRKVSSFSYTRFTELRNATVTGNLALVANFTLDNVKVLGTVNGGSGTITLKNSMVSWGTEPDANTKIVATGSSVSSSTSWTSNHQMDIRDCDFGISVDNVADNTTATSDIVIVKSRLTKASNVIKTKKLTIRDSYLKNQQVTVYPYKDGADYKVFLDFCGNVVDNTANIRFTRLDSVGGVDDTACKEMKLQATIVGNVFSGSGNLTIDFWADPSRRLLYLSNGSGKHSYRYEGNSGTCPLEKWTGHLDSTENSYSWVYGRDGSTPAQWYVYQVGRVSPNFEEIGSFVNGFYSNWAKYAWRETFSYQNYGTAAALDDTVKGDWFDCMFVSTTDVTGAVRVV